MSANLYNLDKDSLRCVLDQLEMNDILTLRKVSFNIQWTIDEINPNFGIREVSICLETRRILLTIVTDRYWCLTYRDGERGRGFQRVGCLVSKRKGGQAVFLENENYMDVFARDLEILLSNRKSVLDSFRIKLGLYENENNKLIRIISTALESNPRQLQVKEFAMGVHNQSQMFEIFRCISPENLELIKLKRPTERSDLINSLKSKGLSRNVPLEINCACELDQWKQAERLGMEDLTIDIRHNLTHFKQFDIQVDKITPDDLLFLKEKLKKSADFVQANIKYNSFDEQDRLIQVFPGFEYIPGVNKYCLFKFSETKRKLLFAFYPQMSSITIQNLKKSEKPSDVYEIME